MKPSWSLRDPGALLRLALAFGLGLALTGGAVPGLRFLWLAFRHAGF